jgi:threonine dehydratase
VTVTFADIEAARATIGDAVLRSPCPYSHALSEIAGAKVYLKLENLQMTGSFKERGACNRLSVLSAGDRAQGVVAASAGNHAQGVAYHARRLGIDATIVMPESTPLVKVSATRRYGANVVLSGSGYDEAYEAARRIETDEKRVFVHPFDDELVIAGQGTIGLELLEQNPYLDAVIVAVGGGGLAAGVALAIKETNPRVKVYGVEPENVASMRAAFAHGGPTTIAGKPTIADGVAVRTVGATTYDVCRRYLDDIVTVDEEEIAEALLFLLEREKTVAEGAGAVPVAALLHNRLPIAGKRVAAVVCGGNIDVNVIARVIERGLAKSGRLARLRVILPDVPGSLADALRLVSEARANVLQIVHDRAEMDLPLGEVEVELVAEVRGFDHIEELREGFRRAGFRLR